MSFIQTQGMLYQQDFKYDLNGMTVSLSWEGEKVVIPHENPAFSSGRRGMV